MQGGIAECRHGKAQERCAAIMGSVGTAEQIVPQEARFGDRALH